MTSLNPTSPSTSPPRGPKVSPPQNPRFPISPRKEPRFPAPPPRHILTRDLHPSLLPESCLLYSSRPTGPAPISASASTAHAIVRPALVQKQKARDAGDAGDVTDVAREIATRLAKLQKDIELEKMLIEAWQRRRRDG